MQTNKLNYPKITDQPEHRAANEKLMLFMAEHKGAMQLLDQLKAERDARTSERPNDKEDAISAADDLLSKHLKDTLPQQITDAMRAVSVLENAIKAQRLVLADVTRTLSVEAGKQLMPRHKVIVKKIASAIRALHEANTEEWMMRDELVRLGYMGQAVPSLAYEGAHDPNDSTGSPAYYWSQHSMSYIQDTGK